MDFPWHVGGLFVWVAARGLGGEDREPQDRKSNRRPCFSFLRTDDFLERLQ